MPSPFPGMDPYLEDEALWPVFHHQLVMCLYQILLPGLVDRYRARVNQRHYVTEQALFTSVVREERLRTADESRVSASAYTSPNTRPMMSSPAVMRLIRRGVPLNMRRIPVAGAVSWSLEAERWISASRVPP